MSEEKPKRAPRRPKEDKAQGESSEQVATPTEPRPTRAKKAASKTAASPEASQVEAGSTGTTVVVPEAYRGLVVVQVVDAVTYGAPSKMADVVVQVEGAIKPPVRKSNGMVVFTDVPMGARQVRISGGPYHAETLVVQPETLNPTYPVLLVPLQPLAAYPFADSTTLIRASVRDEQGRPLSDVPVRATVLTEACAKARLMQEVQAGTSELSLARVAGRMQLGERFYLSGISVDKSESSIVYEVGTGHRSLRLVTPLCHDYPRQTQLLPCVETRSDARGELVLAFGNCRSAAFDVQLQVMGDGKTPTKEVRVEEGRTTFLGVITT